jgi:hypothetical protein
VRKTRDVKKSGTHFEQIPLEVVKKIADQEESKTETAETGNLIIERVSGKNRALHPGRTFGPWNRVLSLR